MALSEEEYKLLKNQADLNTEVIEDFRKSLEDLRKGKFTLRA